MTRRERPQNFTIKVNTDTTYNRLDNAEITGDITATEQFTYQSQANNGLLMGVKLSAAGFTATDIFRLVNERFIDYISLIDYINTIDTINTINNIGRIGSIPQISSSPNIIKNGNFATENFTGWDAASIGASINLNTAAYYIPAIFAVLQTAGITAGFLTQNLPTLMAPTFYTSFQAVSINASANNFNVVFTFTDGTTETHTLSVPAVLTQYFINPTTLKRLASVTYSQIVAVNDTIWITQIVGTADFTDNSSEPSNANVVIPKAVGKTTIVAQNAITNGTVTVYTVPAGKTFYLVGGNLGVQGSGSGSGEALVGGVALAVLSIVNSTTSNPITLAVPMPFAAGTVFQVLSTSANVAATFSLFGWTE
jgi:hypothetical protein